MSATSKEMALEPAQLAAGALQAGAPWHDGLVADDHMKVSYVLESAIDVRQRHQFFRWSQGMLQTLLSHEILICTLWSGRGAPVTSQYFSSTRYFREEHFESLVEPVSGAIGQMAGRWRQAGAPLMLDRALCSSLDAALLDKIEDNELKNAVVQGVWSVCGELSGLYVFGRVPLATARGRTVLFTEMLVPTIHATFSRVLRSESPVVSGASRGILRARELQIIRLIREGRTNADIASVLKLSPWTVKNHLHNILKKLGAENRSQAVASAMVLGLFEAD
jgi:transcriptional regulator EpsA